MKHIISLSGGLASYITIKRVIAKYGKEDVIAVFCDVQEENDDLYRFLVDIENRLNLKIVYLCDGRTPTQLQIEQKFIFNSRVANCSKELKTKPFNKWLKENYAPDQCILYMGIDWSEMHRCEAITKNYAPYKVEYPLCEEMKYKEEYLYELQSDSISKPYLYKIGLTHNNCDGMCVKAGIGHYLRLLENDRAKFLKAERKEQMLIQKIRECNNDQTLEYAHLKRRGKPYTLHQLRMDAESHPTIFDFDECNDFGACTCFSEMD